jgi:hypothetical protein
MRVVKTLAGPMRGWKRRQLERSCRKMPLPGGHAGLAGIGHHGPRVGTAIDMRCFAALTRAMEKLEGATTPKAEKTAT